MRFDAHRRLDRRDVDLRDVEIDADVVGDALPVLRGEVHGDLGERGEQVEVGRERGHGAVEEQQILDVEHQLLRHAGAVAEERLGDVADLADQLVGRHLRRVAHRAVKIEIANDGVDVRIDRERAELAERLHLHADVARGPGQHELQEGLALGLVESAGDAVVEQCGAPIGQHEQVATVEVAVEDAVEHGPLEERDHAGFHDRLGVDARRLHANCVVEGEPREALHHEHPLGDQRGMRTGHDHLALVGEGQHLGDVEHVVGLEAEVELFDDGLGEQLDEGRRVGQRSDRDAPDQVRREPAHRLQVLRDQVGDRRPLHLHHDLLARHELRAVHLGDRRSRDRCAIEAGEHGIERCAEVSLDRLADHLERLGRHLVAQEAELAHQLGREDSLARRQDLAHLDVGRAKPFERFAKPLRHAGPADFATLRLLLDLPQQQRRAQDASGADHPWPRRQPAGSGERWDGGPGAGPDPVEADPPHHCIGVDDPRPVGGERAKVQVARRLFVDPQAGRVRHLRDPTGDPWATSPSPCPCEHAGRGRDRRSGQPKGWRRQDHRGARAGRGRPSPG